MEYLIRCGRYASCVHAGGLSCYVIVIMNGYMLVVSACVKTPFLYHKSMCKLHGHVQRDHYRAAWNALMAMFSLGFSKIGNTTPLRDKSSSLFMSGVMIYLSHRCQNLRRHLLSSKLPKVCLS